VYDAVLFDLDHTLCERTQDIDAAFAAAFGRLGVEQFGEPSELWATLEGPPDPDDRAGYLGAGFARLAAQYDRSVDPVALGKALLAEIDNAQVSFVDGAQEVLRRLGESHATGVVTNGPSNRQAAKVDALGLDEMVDVVVYGGDLPRRKPHSGPFDEALSALGVTAERALYVGDSLAHDVAGAHNAGLDVAWLCTDREGDPAPYRPRYVVDDLTELLDLV